MLLCVRCVGDGSLCCKTGRGTPGHLFVIFIYVGELLGAQTISPGSGGRGPPVDDDSDMELDPKRPTQLLILKENFKQIVETKYESFTVGCPKKTLNI